MIRAGAYFEAVKRLPLATADRLTGGEPFVVISPHPDDESLGAGGLIASACRSNRSVAIIALTDGSGSHPNSTAFPQKQLIDLRKRELEAAALALGLRHDDIYHLNFPDTQAPSHGPAFDAALAALLPIIRRIGARSGFVTWEGDPHCDHQAAANLAKAVRRCIPDFKLWAYPIWGWHLDDGAAVTQPAPAGFRIDISTDLRTKYAAIEAHKSQMTGLIHDDPNGFRFTAETLAPFLGSFEYFLEVPDR